MAPDFYYDLSEIEIYLNAQADKASLLKNKIRICDLMSKGLWKEEKL
jgi:hypothetical protein